MASANRLANRIILPATVIGELPHGIRKGAKFEENTRKLPESLTEPQVSVHPVTTRTAEIYGEFVVHLQRNGTPIPTNDIWITAAAHECQGGLVSSDDHFQYLPQVDREED